MRVQEPTLAGTSEVPPAAFARPVALASYAIANLGKVGGVLVRRRDWRRGAGDRGGWRMLIAPHNYSSLTEDRTFAPIHRTFAFAPDVCGSRALRVATVP